MAWCLMSHLIANLGAVVNEAAARTRITHESVVGNTQSPLYRRRGIRTRREIGIMVVKGRRAERDALIEKGDSNCVCLFMFSNAVSSISKSA